MTSVMLSKQRCYHHGQREAVARCPQCQRYFCRECVTEHHHQMLCNECLSRITDKSSEDKRRWLQGWGILAQGVMGFVLLWYAFYLIGVTLLAIPHDFHEGTIWQAEWWKSP